MTHMLELPALDGRDPLGFLAALGAFRLLSEESDDEVRLSFSDQSAVARLHSPYESCDEVVGALKAVLGRIPDGGYLPDVKPGFPLPAGTGADPMRVKPREDYSPGGSQRKNTLYERAVSGGGTSALSWLSVLVTDLARDDGGRAALTPFSAPFGKMNVRTFVDAPTRAVRNNPEHLREALVGWRRTPGFIGEFFDHRAWRNPADDAQGGSVASGVPGATWLALMALPLLRIGGNGQAVSATLWQPTRPPLMAWPIWRQPLDLPAVRTLIEHPDLSVERRGGEARLERGKAAVLRALGVFAVGAAQRLPVDERGYARPLTPVSVTFM